MARVQLTETRKTIAAMVAMRFGAGASSTRLIGGASAAESFVGFSAMDMLEPKPGSSLVTRDLGPESVRLRDDAMWQNPTMTTTLDWFGCATFRLRTADLTIMLDAYIDRAAGAAGPRDENDTPLTAATIDQCDWIVVGHAHFDHLYGAEQIMANTDATLIGNYESIRVMERAGVPIERMLCVAGGETIELGSGVRVSVYPSQHSCVWSHGQMSQAGDVCIGDVDVTLQEQQERFAALMAHLSDLGDAASQHLAASMVGHSERGDGGALVFVFETPDGSIFYQDTSGHWSGVLRDLRPDVALIGAAGRGNIDGEPIQGSLAQFVGRQIDLLRPRSVVLTHHDDWLPGFSVPTDVQPIRDEIARIRPGTRFLELGYVDGTSILPA